MVTVPHVLSAMSSIVVRNEFCEKVDEAGGIIHILDILAAHPDIEVGLVKYNCVSLYFFVSIMLTKDHPRRHKAELK